MIQTLRNRERFFPGDKVPLATKLAAAFLQKWEWFEPGRHHFLKHYSHFIENHHYDAVRVASWLAVRNPGLSQQFTDEVRRQRDVLAEAFKIQAIGRNGEEKESDLAIRNVVRKWPETSPTKAIQIGWMGFETNCSLSVDIIHDIVRNNKRSARQAATVEEQERFNKRPRKFMRALLDQQQ